MMMGVVGDVVVVGDYDVGGGLVGVYDVDSVDSYDVIFTVGLP